MSEQQLNRNISSEQDKLLNDEMEIEFNGCSPQDY